MSNITCYDSGGNYLKSLYQWDINQTITIHGLDTSATQAVHFCNRLSERALVVNATVSDSVISVPVPNVLLQQPEPITAYVYQETTNDGFRTMHAIHIPVVPRQRPEDYEYEENIDYISTSELDERLSSVEDFISTKTPDGFKYENSLLYLTVDGTTVSDPILINNADDVARNAKINSINHRGYSTKAPENTLPAFLMSKARGFDMVETDIKFTSDGKAVLLHDNTINRTAGNANGTPISASVNISDITYNEALEYDFGLWNNYGESSWNGVKWGGKYAGTKIPTLAQFLELCKENALHPYLEMKSSGLTQANIETAVNEVKAAGMIGRVTWISFNYSTLAAIALLDHVDRLGLIINEDIAQSHIKAVQDLGTNDRRSFIDSSHYANADIAKCVAAGIPMEVWGIPSDTERSIIASLPVYISGVTSSETVASDILHSNKARRSDSAHLYIPYIMQNGLGSNGSQASTDATNQDVLIDFIPVRAGEVYEMHYRVQNTKSPVIRYATFDTAFTQLFNDYSSTPYDTINGYRNRKLTITIAQDGYLRVSCRSYGIASYALLRVKDADGVVLPSGTRLVLERLSAAEDAMAAKLVPMTGATSQAAGSAGLAPAPASGDNTKFLRGDGTWASPTAAAMVGASSSVAGSGGSVPAPAAGDNGAFLRGDGAWEKVNANDVDFSSSNFSADCVKDALEELYTSLSGVVTDVNTALAAVIGGGNNA